MSKDNELELQKGAATKPESEDENDGEKNYDHISHGTVSEKTFLNLAAFRSFEQARLLTYMFRD